MWQIIAETAGDDAGITVLTTACFGAGRFAKSAYRLREGVAPVPGLGFVAIAKESGALLGSVRFWPVAIGKDSSLLLGPLAVQPELRGRGIGIQLMQRGIEEARRRGFESVILIGDEPYYARVGFARLPPGQIRMPAPVDPARLLGLSLKPGAILTLSGAVRRARIDEPVSAQSAAVA